MDEYDPNLAPSSNEWNALDESDRIQLVQEYHTREEADLPNAVVHAVFHVTVENQIALGDAMNAAKTLDRLLADGLDRHDAVHAIGAVLAGHMYSMMETESAEFSSEDYAADLEALTAEKWHEMGDLEDE